MCVYCVPLSVSIAVIGYPCSSCLLISSQIYYILLAPFHGFKTFLRTSTGSAGSAHDTQSLGGRSLPDNDVLSDKRTNRLPGIDDDLTLSRKVHHR